VIPHQPEEGLLKGLRKIFKPKRKEERDEFQKKLHATKFQNLNLAEFKRIQDSNYSAGWSTSLGKLRSQNQDAILAVSTTIKSGSLDRFIGIFAVADGMGGHRDGDLASQIAIQAFLSNTLPELTTHSEVQASRPDTDRVKEILQTGTLAAHRQVSEEVPGGGTTFTAAVIIGDQVVITHTGDSRAYFVNEKSELKLLTRDHSVVNRMIELGRITEKQAAEHPRRNVLYRALGQAEFNQPDISVHSISNSKYLLLCSDGLWGVLSENKISEIINSTLTPQLACLKMVEETNKAGGPDNISTILVRFPGFQK
jgi:serine/threonine protein phosphatase PrpC